MRELYIAGRRIADDEPPFIIAEIGTNHQGSVETCKALFKAAAQAGVDAVKLQKRDNQTLFTEEFYNQPYNSENAFGSTYGTHREALEFGWGEYVDLKAYAESLGLLFFATAFDIPSADFLAQLGIPAFKVASGDLTNIPLIQHIAAYGKPVIISTGGGDAQAVYDTMRSIPFPKQVALLQCTAAYPCPPEELNLNVIRTYRQAFRNTVIGLSDHHDGICYGPVAYTLGARIFEKHFTLSHSWKGADHVFSLEPEGMRRFVRDVQNTAQALGDGRKRPYESEAAGLYKMAKGLVATDDYPVGHVLSIEDLAIQSPAQGLPPYKRDKLLGRPLQQPLAKGQSITSSGVVG